MSCQFIHDQEFVYIFNQVFFIIVFNCIQFISYYVAKCNLSLMFDYFGLESLIIGDFHNLYEE